jgi:hypothetical protein
MQHLDSPVYGLVRRWLLIIFPYHLFTPRLCSLIDGPEVEHGAHFLILYYPTRRERLVSGRGEGGSERR